MLEIKSKDGKKAKHFTEFFFQNTQKNAVCFLEIPKVEESYLFSSGVSTQ